MRLAPLVASAPTECWSALAAAVLALIGEPAEEFDETEERTVVERPRSAKGAA